MSVNPKRPKTLSAAFVKTVRTPGRYGDGRGGHGLSLLVKPTTTGRLSKSWSQRLRIDGKPVNMGLGSFPVVSLAEARAATLSNRRAAGRGLDPRNLAAGVPTFSEAADKVIALNAPNWRNSKSEAQWRASLRDYAGSLSDRKVDAITSGDVLGVLMPIWNDKRETARRVRQRISAIMKWAIASGFRPDNPAGDAIAAVLPKNGGPRRHHAALPHGDVGAALARIRESGAWPTTKLALEFATLTAARSGEVRGARWEEMDLAAATWIVPGDRMKTGREHRVPLSRRALEVLEEARHYRDKDRLVFPSMTGRALSDNTLSKLLRENGIESVVHGMRSSFRDWAGDTGQPRELAEAALAHTVGNAVEAAYARSDLFERRRSMMEDWAEYVSA